MGRWTDIAQWVGPTVNETPGGMSTVLGLVLHIQDGNEQGSIAWCKNPASQVSAHFFAPKVGGLQQLVDTADRAWAVADGNAHWLSIENEGYSGQDLTRGQIEACAQVLAFANKHGLVIPLTVTDHPAYGGLGWHGMGGTGWGGHPDCPGLPVLAQRPAILQRAAQILGRPSAPVSPAPPRSAPPWPGRVLVYRVGEPLMTGQDVHDWQARMHLRGWTIAVDGSYGEQSEGVCVAFQEDSTAHGWILQVDGKVGLHTWSAAWERPVS